MFNRLRRQSWWRAPVFASLAGSVIDTAIFFTIAFAALFAFVGPDDAFALEPAPLLGCFRAEAPRWMSWALGDLAVKLLIAVFALIPYRLIAARWSQPALSVAGCQARSQILAERSASRSERGDAEPLS